MNSTIAERKTIRGGRPSGAARAWLGGAGVALLLGGALAAGTFLTRAPGAAVPAPAWPEVANAVVAPLPDGYATEGLSGYEWRAKGSSGAPGIEAYADEARYEPVPAAAPVAPSVVWSVPGVGRWIDGPQGYQFVPVSAEDGYFDEGLSGYEWRPRPGR